MLAAATVVTLGAGIWLLLHLTALARTFAGNADVVAARAQPRASRRAVHVALATFGGGLLVTLAVLVTRGGRSPGPAALAQPYHRS